MPDRRDLPLRETVIEDPSNILIWFRFTIQGGAFLIWGGALNILNCVISGNRGATGGGFHTIGGAINISNSAEHAMGTGMSDEDVIKLIQQCQQMITSCRGFFGARNTILGGLRQKQKK